MNSLSRVEALESIQYRIVVVSKLMGMGSQWKAQAVCLKIRSETAWLGEY